MSDYIIKLETKNGPRYLIWSTFVDAPITDGMTKEEFERWYLGEHGRHGMEVLPERMRRVTEKGTSSWLHHSVEDLIACNRAGLKEKRLTLEEIIGMYCPK